VDGGGYFMKNFVKFSFLIVLAVFVGCERQQGPSSKTSIGVAIYKFDDTNMTNVRNNIQKAAHGKANIDIVDSQNSQPNQNDKVDLFITRKVNAMIINPVDRTAAGTIVEKAKKANIPVVFLNREPLEEDLMKWDKVYYVGAKAEQSGTMEAEILIDYFKSHQEAYRSHDGVIHFALLRGEAGHQDAELRTKAIQESLKRAGLKFKIIDSANADWDRVKGQEKMAAFLAKDADIIDAVVANNDDMALGAIEALKAKGFFKNGKFMPVVGIDAIAPAVEAVENGTMLGTVLNDAVNIGKASFVFADLLTRNIIPTNENSGYVITAGKYIWVPYKKITKANVNEAK
jgi:methyl-galactoside transport system substrate-binding protein